jgi:hypothetical protein
MKLFSAFSPTAIAALLLTYAAVPLAQHPEAQRAESPSACAIEEFGSGTILASGKAPGGDPSVQITKGPHGSPGNINVTSVWINNVKIDKDKYTIKGQGTIDPEITFHEPDPGAPAQGADVKVYGTTSNGDRKFVGELKWK